MKKLHERKYDADMKTLYERQLAADRRLQSRQVKDRYREALREERARTEIREHSARHSTEDYHRFYTYDLDPIEYRRMVAQQNGVCAICREPDRELCVDHDHRTGRVRSLLCSHCNKAIGFLRESPLLARAAATYLELQLSKEFTGE
jgi:hypothetical protein